MQLKLGAAFLLVALLYVLVGWLQPQLQPDSAFGVILTASSYLLIGLAAAWFLSRVLSRRVRELAAATAVISRGDLTRTVNTSGRDEIADLARSFAAMTDSLTTVVVEVQATSDRVHESANSFSGAAEDMHSTSQDIARMAQEIAQGAKEQACQVSRTTETTRELSRVAERVASRAKSVHQSATEAASRSAAGADDARRASESIGRLSERTVSATAVVEGFRLKATEIDNLVQSITSISDQTHLLAINAAIEAARAGVEGRGFAVVAEEVSRLADSVRQFAERISGLSDEIVSGSREMALEILRSVNGAAEVREVVDRATGSFEGILSAIEGTATQAGEIYELTGQQKRAVEEVTAALSEISSIAVRNAAGTEEASEVNQYQTAAMQAMAGSARSLAESSDQLKELVSIFKLR